MIYPVETIGNLLIYTIGDNYTREFSAIQNLKEIFKDSLKNKKGRLIFISNYFSTNEIDIIIIGDLDEKFTLSINNSKQFKNVSFDKFIFSIEVKDTPNVTVEGSRKVIYVQYHKNTSPDNVTYKVKKQMHILKEDFKKNYNLNCFIVSLIWLRNIQPEKVKEFDKIDNVILNKPEFNLLFRKALLQKNNIVNNGYFEIISPQYLAAFKRMCDQFIKNGPLYTSKQLKERNKVCSLYSAIVDAGEIKGWDVYNKPFSPKDLGIDSSKYGSFSDYCINGTTVSSKWNKREILKPVEFDASRRPKKYVLLTMDS